MTSAHFTVTQAGPLVTVQDIGRAGLMRYGVPASGPMDRMAYCIANLALGNAPDTPAIEVSRAGLSVQCTQGQVDFAVAGGSFQVMLDAQLQPPWTTASIKAGQTLVIRPGRWGSWCYLAFAGQLLSNHWLGSAATHGPSGLGGGMVVAGNSLQVDDAAVRPNLHGAIPIPVSARPRPQIRVVLGPQNRFFGAEAIRDLLSNPFTLTDAYDRMGVRLSGPLLPPNAALDMPSEPIVRGSIQVAGDGVATVLLADHQTTGGYPKIATVLSDDLDGFVQNRSHNMVRFKEITPQEAILIARSRDAARKRYLAQFERSLPKIMRQH